MLSRQRLITTFRDGIARPFVLKVNSRNLELSNNLITFFNESIGIRRYDIEEEIKSFNIEKINPKVIQGLADLLFKRSTFSENSRSDTVELRRLLFSTSAGYWKSVGEGQTDISLHRQNIIRAAAAHGDLPPVIGEQQLFGDYTANQCLSEFDPPTAEQLINRFNIAQVQGLLLDSRSLELRVHRRYGPGLKQLMQMMKFHRLLFMLVETDSNWFTMQIDGPGSILENSRSYGIEIARFFPAILLLNVPWKLTARLKVSNRRRIFTLELTEESPYHSFLQSNNIWTHEKTVALLKRFNEKYGPECRAESDPNIIPLKDNRYLLPDFTVKATDGGKLPAGKRMQVEWIHYPSEARFKWLKQIKSQLPEDYVFAVRGRKNGLKQLVNAMDRHLLLYTRELTAPAVMKKFENRVP